MLYLKYFSYVGVRKVDNSYTSPILEIHTWQEELMQINMNQATLSQRIALGGMQTKRDNADHHIGPVRKAEHRKIELNEEIVCIPIESIISMKYSGEIKKELTEQMHARLKTPPPPVDFSCCGKMNRWCCKTFCCCCNDSESQIHKEPEQIITKISNREAERKILVTVEYIRYSNIHTPSNVRVLSVPDQVAFYKEHLDIDTLKFYLLANRDFEQADFNLKRTQASTLCRLVTQLKSMIGYYPDEPTLEKIIGKRGTFAIGDPPQETIGQSVGSARANVGWETTVPFTAIENRP